MVKYNYNLLMGNAFPIIKVGRVLAILSLAKSLIPREPSLIVNITNLS